MTYQEYLEKAPEITQVLDDALVHTVSKMSLSEAKKLDWMTTSADANIAADAVKAA